MLYNRKIRELNCCLVLLLLPLIIASPITLASSEVVPIDGVKYTINASLMDNIRSLVGKNVVFILENGQTISGKVNSVGAHLVHVEKVERKEFFDALIRIDKIQAIETRFRKYNR